MTHRNIKIRNVLILISWTMQRYRNCTEFSYASSYWFWINSLYHIWCLKHFDDPSSHTVKKMRYVLSIIVHQLYFIWEKIRFICIFISAFLLTKLKRATIFTCSLWSMYLLLMAEIKTTRSAATALVLFCRNIVAWTSEAVINLHWHVLLHHFLQRNVRNNKYNWCWSHHCHAPEHIDSNPLRLRCLWFCPAWWQNPVDKFTVKQLQWMPCGIIHHTCFLIYSSLCLYWCKLS